MMTKGSSKHYFCALALRRAKKLLINAAASSAQTPETHFRCD